MMGPAARVRIVSPWQMTGSLLDISWGWSLSHDAMGADQNEVACSTAISTHKGHLCGNAGRQAGSRPRLAGERDESASIPHLHWTEHGEKVPSFDTHI